MKVDKKFNTMKYTKKFTISFLLTAVLGSIVYGGYSFYSVKNILTNQIRHHLRAIAQPYAEHVDTFINEHKQVVISFADVDFFEEILDKTNGQLPEDDLRELHEELNEFLVAHYDDFEEVFFLNGESVVVASTDLDSIGRTATEHSNLLSKKSPVRVSDIFYSEILKRFVIDISAPVINDRTNKKVGILVATISLERLAEMTTHKNEFRESEEVYLIDRNSLLITPSKFLKGKNKGVLTQRVDTANAKRCLAMTRGEARKDDKISVYFLNYRGKKTVGAHAVVPETRWCLLAEAGQSEVLNEPLKIFSIRLIVIGLLISSGASLAGFALGGLMDKKYLSSHVARD